VEERLGKDQEYVTRGKEYINTVYSNPSYKRIEKLLLKAFSDMPISKKPVLKSSSVEKMYELRSYESATEKLYLNKVDMFNAGGEITLFEQLGFNAVFYGMVLAGRKMPNLMYITSLKIWMNVFLTGKHFRQALNGKTYPPCLNTRKMFQSQRLF
jgi:hypothetical protein